MEVYELLSRALKELERADLPPELRPVGFKMAVELMSREALVNRGTGGGVRDVTGDVARDTVSRIAQAVGMEVSRVEEVYDASDGELAVVVGSGRLAKSNSGASRQLAILVAGGRQLGGLEEWTRVDSLREVCEHFGRYDQANFAATIRGMEKWFGFKGSGRSREIKMNRPGTEELSGLLRDLTEGDQL
ncbi:MAG: hypothetical protein GY769_16110 [bacterium]|nr:hypothetical protein [bacterium]